MAMVRDLFGGRPLVRMLSRLALVSGLAPVLAPVIGSQLLLVMPWRGIFVVLAVYGLFVVICVSCWIVETLPEGASPRRGPLARSRQRYKAVLSDRVFVGIAIVGAHELHRPVLLPLVELVRLPGASTTSTRSSTACSSR